MNTSLSSAYNELTDNKYSSSDEIGITVRRMDLEYDDSAPEFWYDNDPLLTMYLSAFSATLPAGERQFVRSVRLFQNQIMDPKLQKEIRAFIGQEAHHAKEHDTLNEFMKSKGYPIHRIEKRLGYFMRWLSRRSPATQLANTVCAEHITALMANYYMSYAPEEIDKIAPQMRKIWAWHVIEETEHKAVAFDVYQQTVKSKALLRFTMLWLSFAFVLDTAFSTIELMFYTKRISDWRMWAKGVRHFLGKKSLLRLCWSDYADFYRKDYHPWQHDVGERLADFKNQYLNPAAS